MQPHSSEIASPSKENAHLTRVGRQKCNPFSRKCVEHATSSSINALRPPSYKILWCLGGQFLLDTTKPIYFINEGEISCEVATQQFRCLPTHARCHPPWEQQHDFADASCSCHGRASLTSAAKWVYELDVIQFLNHVRVPRLSPPLPPLPSRNTDVLCHFHFEVTQILGYIKSHGVGQILTIADGCSF